jgi:curved DNA-binding protein
VRIRGHPRFRVEGRNLHTDLPVAPWEAALGASIELATLEGTSRVKVPEGSSCGRKLRLRGQGMPNPGGRPGDLYAHVQIKVPRQPTERERELFERLSAESGFDARARR